MQAVTDMALVPFRVSGIAADQTLEHRLFQIRQHTIKIAQDVHKSGSLQRVGVQHIYDASSGTACFARIPRHADEVMI